VAQYWLQIVAHFALQFNMPVLGQRAMIEKVMTIDGLVV